MILEAVASNHYLLRKQERGNILKISTAPEVYEGYDKAIVFSALKQEIESKLFRILSALEGVGKSDKSRDYKAFRILHPYIVYKGTTYPVYLEVEYTKFHKDGTTSKEKNVGNTYAIIKGGNTLVTLLLIKEQTDLYAQAFNSLKNNKKVDIATAKLKEIISVRYDLEIDLEELIQGKTIEKREAEVRKEDLPYKVRTDYRKGGNFEHDVYGTGTIVTTSVGVKGDPGSAGVLDWVEVDFGKPYVKGGEYYTTRKIPKVYATAYWLDKK